MRDALALRATVPLPIPERRERHYTVLGHSLCVCEWGPADGPPVVLVHGILDQALAWEAVAERLAREGLRVIAPDLRGHGLSSHAEPGQGYSVLMFAADLAALLRELAVKPVVLAGHSLGSLVSVMYASTYRERASALLLVETFLPSGVDALDMPVQVEKELDYLLGEHVHRPVDSVDQAARLLRAVHRELDADFARRLCERSTRPENGKVSWRWDPILRSRVGMRFHGTRAQYCDLLRNIDARVRLLFGRDSRFRRSGEEERLIGALRNGDARYTAGGHNLHLSAPEAVADAVIELVAAVSGNTVSVVEPPSTRPPD